MPCVLFSPLDAEQEILETMLHELAHCRWRNHSDHFWWYMAQLGRVRRAGTLTAVHSCS